ncbi:DNA methyltransferase [Spirulina sp. CS-785/01]|uniref:DNA methyltransferase n=1 Tax=Spirulina sp. CS-785/01 TaxID=3021716 RepID=UPI00232C0B2B|nr:DNA methyltransferase [Spirulina sp. CS-785/01]MDB9313831.1 DNA methyltransferase [Spirulina sp. CS-785/01]
MLNPTTNQSTNRPTQTNPNSDLDFLNQIKTLDEALTNYFAHTLTVDNCLTRKLVSFQANKNRNYYRWYKYKEAFSADLVEYLIKKYPLKTGKILDPFAGAGTTLFACSALGYDAEGIEVLPVGQKIIEANILARSEYKEEIITGLERWLGQKPWNTDGETKKFEILRITNGAYSQETHQKIQRYLYEIENENNALKEILLFVLLCVLESISYTRKDGQYLRWDYRSERKGVRSTFDKGKILSFDDAINQKIKELKNDIPLQDKKQDLFSLLEPEKKAGKVNLLKGSCLEISPNLDSNHYSGIITSPPYCNRYDYTRTYALEHAILGITEPELIELRQAMVSCTVESKAKKILEINPTWKTAIESCNHQELLQAITKYLDYKRNKKELNNNGIYRMVKNYFYEMACIIQECYRVLKKDGLIFMVNDNVRYAGAVISIDTILSKIAEDIGFKIENILILPQGKGNSSQQMGKHGRQVVRKCIYIWKK